MKYRVSFFKRRNTVEFEAFYVEAKNHDEAVIEARKQTELTILASVTTCEAR